MKIGYIRKRAGLPSIKDQEYAIAQVGVDRDFIWCENNGDQTLSEMMESVRPCDEIVVYALMALAPDKTQSKRRPSALAADVTKAIEDAHASVRTVISGELYQHPERSADLARDAIAAVAGYRKKLPHGRPSKPEPSDDDKAKAKAIWCSLEYKTNKDAAKELKAIGWSKAMAYKYIGPSGRAAGRPKT